jgi:hypothetical protein
MLKKRKFVEKEKGNYEVQQNRALDLANILIKRLSKGCAHLPSKIKKKSRRNIAVRIFLLLVPVPVWCYR